MTKRNLATYSCLLLMGGFGSSALAHEHATKTTVLETYANIAEAKFGDSLTTAKRLQTSVAALIKTPPSAANLEAAKKAWLAARVPYQQTEVYRFGNAIVDDWEAK